MSTPYYTATGNPASGSGGSSSLVRAEFTAIAAGFDLLPVLAGNQNYIIMVNAGATALTRVAQTFSLGADFTTVGAYALTLTSTATTSIILPASGTAVTLAGTQTLTNKTLTGVSVTNPAFSGTAAGGSYFNGYTLTTPSFTSCTIQSVTLNNPVLAGTVSGTNPFYVGASTGVLTLTTPTLTTPTLTTCLVKTGSTLTLTSGQIKFNNAHALYSTDRQFAHYEEGTWTPSIQNGGTTTYTTQTGTFTRIGNLVHAYCYLVINTLDAGVDTYSAGIIGLPYLKWPSIQDGFPVYVQGANTIDGITAFTEVASGVMRVRFFAKLTNLGLQPIYKAGMTIAFSVWYITLDQ